MEIIMKGFKNHHPTYIELKPFPFLKPMNSSVNIDNTFAVAWSLSCDSCNLADFCGLPGPVRVGFPRQES